MPYYPDALTLGLCSCVVNTAAQRMIAHLKPTKNQMFVLFSEKFVRYFIIGAGQLCNILCIQRKCPRGFSYRIHLNYYLIYDYIWSQCGWIMKLLTRFTDDNQWKRPFCIRSQFVRTFHFHNQKKKKKKIKSFFLSS